MESKKILLIDDDSSFTAVMQDVMEIEGYIFSSVSEAPDVIDLVRREQPDLILLDYCMPGRNGGELCNLINVCNDLKGIPVVLLSAYPKEQLPLAQVPFSVFIPKPFDLWEFLACVNELITLKGIMAA